MSKAQLQTIIEVIYYVVYGYGDIVDKDKEFTKV